MKILVILILATAISVTTNASYLPDVDEFLYNYDQFAQSMNYFNAKMYKIVIELSENKNVVFSPLSISQVVGMILSGAGSNTKIEIKNVLNVSSVPDAIVHDNMREVQSLLIGDGTGPTLNVANGLFVQEQYHLYDNYTQLLENSYHSTSQSFNPSNPQEAANRINRWVADRTDNMIQNLVQPSMFNSLTRLALLNAVYFNGKWKDAFEARRFPMLFHLAKGYARVKGMNLRSRLRRYNDRALRMRFVAIPYDSQGSPTTYMVIGLPGQLGGLTKLTPVAIKSLATLDPSAWVKQDTMVTMPKFNISSEVKAKKLLKMMGIRDLFSETLSDLSGMSGEPLYCSDFVHKSKIEVDEKGTRAAAATAAIIMSRMYNPDLQFNVNQPFFFGIYNVPSKMFIFMGRVVDPRQK